MPKARLLSAGSTIIELTAGNTRIGLALIGWRAVSVILVRANDTLWRR